MALSSAEVPYKFSKEIKRRRLSRKITQEEFAEKVGVTWSSVARWETGEVAPTIKYLPKFGEIPGVSEQDLLNSSSGTAPPKNTRKPDPTYLIARRKKS